jgi:hypothetical protein
MNPQNNAGSEAVQSRPWYKEPWPWVIISIPAAAVIMGFITLYLALTRPDYLVVEDEQYRTIKAELHAQPSPGIPSETDASQGANEDGEH